MGLRRLDNRDRGLAGFVAAIVLVATLGGPAAAQEAETDRDAVRAQQDRLAEQVDVLEASDAEIAAALDELEAAIATQEVALGEAQAAAAAADAAEARAEADLRAAHHDVEVLQEAIREMAVASYVHPPTADLVQSLQARSISDSLKQRIYLDARAQRDLDLLGLLEAAETRAEDRAEELAAAAVAADRAVEAADAELARLAAEREQQAAFAADLQVRIDRALAEAAALADLDAELSAQIAAEQAALLTRLPPPPEQPAPTGGSTAPLATAPPTTRAEPDSGQAAAPATTTTAPPTPTTTAPRRPSPPITAPATPPLRTVRGFTVHAEIAGDVEAMLAAAAADGVVFGGSAYRSSQRQIELRLAHCGPTDFDVWHRSAGSCSPPTAVPGRSLHEQGRALDLTVDGRLITSRANRGFQWLAANAASYGLFNLPSEPWHWSTTGH